MSAFQVSSAHLSAIVTAWFNLGIRASEWRLAGALLRNDDADDWQRAFDQLSAANAASVGYRYRETCEPVAGEVRIKPVSIIQAIKAIDCLDYQSCEVPGWEETEPARNLARLRDALTRKLPGYDAAEWSIT
jgi:broad specificity phosphatase PhoE